MTRKFLLFAFTLLTLVPAARAELFSFGLKGGVPLNDALNLDPKPTFPFTNNRRYTIGPQIELHLPAGLGIEVDALYKSVAYRESRGEVSGNVWEFPLLLKSRLLPGPVKPYLEAGVAFRKFSELTGVLTFNPGDNISPGLVLGGGVEVKALIIRVSGEVRYTRFTSDGSFPAPLKFNKNQAEVLFGITF